MKTAAGAAPDLALDSHPSGFVSVALRARGALLLLLLPVLDSFPSRDGFCSLRPFQVPEKRAPFRAEARLHLRHLKDLRSAPALRQLRPPIHGRCWRSILASKILGHYLHFGPAGVVKGSPATGSSITLLGAGVGENHGTASASASVSASIADTRNPRGCAAAQRNVLLTPQLAERLLNSSASLGVAYKRF